MKVNTPALKIQIEIIEAFLIELDKIIQFPRFIQVEKEKIVEKEVNVPVLVPTKDSISIRNELSYGLLVEKLIGAIKKIKRNNQNVNLELDEDLQLIFFSELFGGAQLTEDLNSQLRSYKESSYNKLFSLGKQWSTDHELIVNTIIEERFDMANMIKHANLEIEKSRAISDQRLEGFKILKQSFTTVQSKLDSFEREFGIVAQSLGNDNKASGELRRLFGGLTDLKGIISSDIRTVQIEEPFQLLGEIHGTDGNYLRLQSAFRSLEQENTLLRNKYVKWQGELPNVHAIEDKEKIIAHLTRQIVGLT